MAGKYGPHWLFSSIMYFYCHLEVMRSTCGSFQSSAAEALHMLLRIDTSSEAVKPRKRSKHQTTEKQLGTSLGQLLWRYSNDSGHYSTRPLGWMQYVNLSVNYSEAKSVP